MHELFGSHHLGFEYGPIGINDSWDCLAAMSHRPILSPLDSRGRARRRCLAIASKFDALPSGEAADIKCGDMKAETGVVGWLVYRIVPAVMTPVDFGGTGQRDGNLVHA